MLHPLGRYIKQSAVMLKDRFHSDVPKTVDDLCSLPGVGPKMAFLCLQSAWDVYGAVPNPSYLNADTLPATSGLEWMFMSTG
jgi:hypothetical protein